VNGKTSPGTESHLCLDLLELIDEVERDLSAEPAELAS